MFNVGDKVVCINAKNWANNHIYKSAGYNVTYPVENGIYTVRGITEQSILLEEIVNPLMLMSSGAKEEAKFFKYRFVKLSDLQEMDEALEEAKHILEMQMA